MGKGYPRWRPDQRITYPRRKARTPGGDQNTDTGEPATGFLQR
jgi:hypothetical protein